MNPSGACCSSMASCRESLRGLRTATNGKTALAGPAFRTQTHPEGGEDRLTAGCLALSSANGAGWQEPGVARR